MQALSRRTFAQGTLLSLLHWLGVCGPAGAHDQPAGAHDQPGDGVTLVARGRPAFTLVTSDRPNDSVRYAAVELGWHIQKATGFQPAIVTESKVRSASLDKAHVFLGDTHFARKAGINFDALGPESCAIRTIGRHLCIAGHDTPGSPLDENTSAGTLFGAYELLDRYFAVRWLWPGELGTFVPRAESVVVPAQDCVVTPRLVQRHVRSAAGLRAKDHPEMGFTAAAAEEYMSAQAAFLRRNRMGRRIPANYGHAFVDWWQQYGGEHPEWFQLVNGKRGPSRPGGRFSMCISNPGLHEEIVSQWRQHGNGSQEHPPIFVNAVENDIPGQCECDVCKALDGPEPSNYRKFIPSKSKIAGKPFVSDRYARSWQAIQQIAAKYNSNAVVVGYAYMNYFAAPTSGVKLGSNIIIGFCPSSWFYPRSDEDQGWIKDQWQGWAKTDASLLMRTNYFLDGYCMPHIFTNQFSDEFQKASSNGMIGTDFDSLTGHWATQGPNIYLLMRLQMHPDVSASSILSEYYSAFGPAADDVKKYFDFWEAYTSNGRTRLHDTFEALGASRWRSWAKAAHAIYPEESFAPAEALLDRAVSSAKGDQEASMRVKFLQLGLQHAKLCSQAASKLTLGDPDSSYERGRPELQALLEFRRAHERMWISNLNHCAWVESTSWTLPGAAVQSQDPGPE